MNRTLVVILAVWASILMLHAQATEANCPIGIEPIERVTPHYPTTSGGKNEPEGWVVVEFTILTDGRTKTPRVIESSLARFELSALRAILKSRYPEQSTPCVHRERVLFTVE